MLLSSKKEHFLKLGKKVDDSQKHNFKQKKQVTEGYTWMFPFIESSRTDKAILRNQNSGCLGQEIVID